jgi:spore coat protein CotH
MTVDGLRFTDVGVHFRGNSSYSQVPAGYKRSLNISLDLAHESQALGGYHTLNLLNAFGDPTFLKGILYTEIARQYLPTPRMNHVRLVINGESWGIYLNAQQFNKDFTRDYFGTTQGARWKTPGSPRGMAGLEYLGESADAYQGIYEIKTKDTKASWAALAKMTRILNETPLEKLESALAPVLDVDRALKFLAVEVALVNSDGYWTRASDYSLFQDPKGVFHVLPYDVNEALGEGRGGFGFGGGPDLDPLVGLQDSSKPLRSRLLSVPALRSRYLGYMRDIAQRHLDWTVQAPRVKQYQALIAGDVKADTKKLYSTEAFASDVASIQSFFTRRRAILLQ